MPENPNGSGPKKETKPTRYAVLYRLEGDPPSMYREATEFVPGGDDDPQENAARLVIHGKGQSEARKAFFAAITADEKPRWWPHDDHPVAQVAVIPFSSWDPKAPRAKTLVAWE